MRHGHPTSTSHARFASRRHWLVASTALCVALPAVGMAGPEGGTVAHGTANIQQSGLQTTITQGSERAVLDWQSFNLGVSERAQFVQPSSASVTVNRIHDANLSNIQGTLSANGHVVLINPNGVLFGPNAKLDVQGLVASTASPTAAEAQAWASGARNDLALSQAGNAAGEIRNEGQITAGSAGLVGFIAPTVSNSGVIAAQAGKVHLASGETATLDLAGDGLVNIAVSDSVVRQLAENKGLIQADGGTVLLSAAAGQQVASGVINMEGVIQARSLENRNGRIILAAEGSNAVAGNNEALKGVKTGESRVTISGSLDATGNATGQTGGAVTVTADRVHLAPAARIDASGAQGGGEVRLGGDYLGKGSTATAKTLTVTQGAQIKANATVQGMGGRVIAWSDGATAFQGNIEAKGKGTEGKGGFVETSGKQTLNVTNARVDLTDETGGAGTWLLDPTDIILYNRTGSADGTNSFTTAQLEAMSVGANVSLSATNNITFDLTGDTLTLATNRNLTLTAGNNILTASVGTLTVSGTGGLLLDTGRDINFTNDLDLTTGTGGVTLRANNNIISTGGGDITANGGAITLNADRDADGGGGIKLTSGSDILSNGGAITLGGGATPLTAATGNVDSDQGGLFLTNSTLDAAGGNISIRTRGLFGGFRSDGGTVRTTGAGTILIDGSSTSGSGNLIVGTIQTQNGNLTITGTGGNDVGLILAGGSSKIESTGSGNIVLTGTGGGSSGGSFGFVENGGSIVSNSGDITITAIKGVNSGGYKVESPITIGNATTSGRLTIVTDSFFGNPTLRTTGDVVIRPYTAGTTVGIGSGAGSLSITDALLNSITYGGRLWLGGFGATNASPGYVNDSGAMTVNSTFIFNKNVSFLSGASLSLTGSLLKESGGASTMELRADGALTLSGFNAGGGKFGGATTIIASGAGNVLTLNMVANEDGIGTDGLDLSSGGVIASNGGNISLLAKSGTVTTAGINTGVGNLSLIGADAVINGNFNGTGALALRPFAIGSTVRVNFFSGDFNLSTAELTRIRNGWSSIEVGRADDLNNFNMGAASWQDPVTLRGYNVNIYGNLTGTGDAAFTFQDAGSSLFNNATITTAGGAVRFNNALNLNGNGGTINTSGGNITFTGALTHSGATGHTLALNAGSGTVAFGSTVDGTQTVNASAGSFTFGGLWGGATALGGVSLTSANTSFTMPNLISTGAIALNAGTGIISTNSIAAGAGNLTLDAGDVNFGGNIGGSGVLSLRQASNEAKFNRGTATGFYLGTTDINYIQDGWTQINLGRNGAGLFGILIGPSTWKDPVNIIGNSGWGNDLVGALVGTGNASFTFTGGYGDLNDGSSITTAGGAISLAASDNIDFLRNTTLTSNGGAISLGNTNLAGNTTINSGAGTTAFNMVNGANNLTANAGSFTFNGAWGATNALGNVSLTSANTSFTLPNLTATGNVALNAGTGTIATGTISTGAGNLSLLSGGIALGGNLTGTGLLTLAPSGNVTVGIGSASTGVYKLDDAELAYLADGWSGINLGSATNTAATDLRAATWKDPVTFLSGTGAIGVNGVQTGSGNSSFTFSGPTTLAADLNSTNNAITFNGATTVTGGARDTNAGSGLITINGDFSGNGFNTSFTSGDIAINNNLRSPGGNTLSLNRFGDGAYNIAGGSGGYQLSAAELDRLINWFSLNFTGSNLLDAYDYNWGNRGVNFRINDGGTLTVQGAQTTTGFVSLRTLTGSASFAINGALTSNTLELINSGTTTQTAAITADSAAFVGTGGSTSGNYQLTHASNAFGTIAGRVTTLNFAESNGFDIGAASGNVGLTGTNIHLSTPGTVTQSQAITATNLLLQGAGSYNLLNNSNNVATIAANSAGLINFNNGNAALNIGTVNGTNGVTATSFGIANTGTTTQTQAITAANLDLSGFAGTGTFTLTHAGNAISNLTGNAAATVNFVENSGFTLASSYGFSATNLYLSSTGTVNQTNGLTVTNLLLQGTGGIYNLTNSANAIATLAANTGTVNLREDSGFAIGAVNGVAGIQTTYTTLSSTGAVTQSERLIAGGLLLSGIGGSYNLANTGNVVGTLAGSTGSVDLANGNNSLTIGSVHGTNGLTTTGNASLNAGTGTITTTQAIATGAGNLTLTADDLALGANLSGTGILTLQPSSANRIVKVNHLTGDFNLDSAELGRLADGWSQINIGRTDNVSGDFTIGAASFADPVNFRTGSHRIAVLGPVAGTGNASVTFSGGAGSRTNLFGDVSTSGQAIAFGTSLLNADTGTVASGGGAITAGQIMLSTSSPVAFNSAGGTVSLGLIGETGSAAGKTLAVNAGAGAVNFLSGINTAANLTANAGSYTFNGTWGGTTPLGNVSLTSANTNIALPAITTMGNVTISAGTGTITTGTIATGAGNLTLTSDDVVIGGALSGTGILTLQPATDSRVMRLNYGAGDYNLTTAELSNITDGWNTVNIHRTAGTGNIELGALTWQDPVVFRGAGFVRVSDTLTGTGNAGFNFQNSIVDLYGDIFTAGGAVNFSSALLSLKAGRSVVTNGGTITLGTIFNNGEPLSLHAGGGAINFTAALESSGGYPARFNLNANAGSFTFNGAWGSTNAMGSIGLNSGSSVTLPSITAIGNVNIDAGVNTITTGSIATGAGNLTLTADDVNLGGAISGTGTLGLRPHSGVYVLLQNGAGSAFFLTNTDIDNIANGWGQINIGRAGAQGIAIYDTMNFKDPVTFVGNSGWSNEVRSALVGTGDASFTFSGSGYINLANGSITTAGGKIDLSSNSFVTSNFYAGANALTSNGGAILLPRVELDQNLTLNSGAGTITFGSTIDGAAALTANAGGFTFNGAWGGSTPLGNVSLTSASTLMLPSITAASILARTTGAGADIALGAGRVLSASNSGTALTLASADDFINGGGAGALSTPSGRWLVYSEKPADNTLGGLTGGFNRYGCVYGGSCPSLPASGNGLLYSGNLSLTATPTLQNVIYGNGALLSGYGYSLSGYEAGDAGADSITGSLTGTSLYAAGNDVGTYGLNYASGSLASALGYTITYADNASAILVAPRTLTAALTGTVSKTYDGLTAAILGSGNYSLSNIYSADDVSLANFASGSYDTKNAGTGKNVSVSGLTLGGAKAGNYVLASGSVSGAVGTILAKILTASLTGTVSKTYDMTADATLAAGNYALSGIVGGEAVGLNNPSLGTYDNKNVGTGKNVSVSGLALSGADAGNYSLASTSASGALGTILAKAVTASLTGTVSKTYDTTTSAVLAAGNYALSGVLGSEAVTLNNPTGGSYNTIHAGSGKLVSVSGLALGGADAGNYTLSSASASAAIGIIDRYTLTAGLTGTVSKTYDATAAATLAGGNYTLTSALGSDAVTLNAAASGLYDTKNAGSGKLVSVSGLTLSGANASDYQLASTGLSAAIGSISARAIGVTGAAVDGKTYDGTAAATLNHVGAALSGILSGDTVSLTTAGATGSFADKNAGANKAVTVSGYGMSGADAGNYTLSQPTGLLGTILAKTLTAALTGTVSKTYDGTNAATLSAGNYALSGVVAADAGSVALNDPASGTYNDKNAGTGKNVSVSGLSLSGAEAGNYSLASTSISGNVGTILAKALSILGVTVQDKIYDGTNAATIDSASATFSGRVGSDAVTLNAGTLSASFLDARAGANKAVTVSGFSLSGADAGNYTLDTSSFGASSATISPKALTVSADAAQSKTYGDADGAFAYSYAGLVGGETMANFTGALSRAAGENAGSYALMLGSLAATGDYAIGGFVPQSFAISPAALSVRAQDATRQAGLPNAPFTLAFTGLRNGDTEAIFTGFALSSDADAASPSGAYAIRLTGGGAANYLVTRQDGLLTVTSAPAPEPQPSFTQLPTTIEQGRLARAIQVQTTDTTSGGNYATGASPFNNVAESIARVSEPGSQNGTADLTLDENPSGLQPSSGDAAGFDQTVAPTGNYGMLVRYTPEMRYQLGVSSSGY